MQYSRRREEGHAAPHRFESGPDPGRRNRRDGSDPVQQRKMSPLKVDGARRGGGGNKGGSDGFQGRDYDWQRVGGGRRSGRGRSRSPPIETVRKRSHFNDGVGHDRSCSPPPPGLRARYELSKTMDYSVNNGNLDAKRIYLDGEKDLVEGRLGGGQGGMVDQKFVVRENEVGGSYKYRSIPDMGVSVTMRYGEAGGHLPPPSRGVSTGRRFEHERLQHRDGPPMDKIPVTESHSGADKIILHARDVSYSSLSPSYTKDFAGTSHMRDYGGSSIEMSRNEFLCSHGDGICLSASYDMSRSCAKFAEPAGFNGHGQRAVLDPARALEIGSRNMICHQRCEFSPTRTGDVDYLNYKSHVRAAQDERLYQYDDLPRRIAPHGRLDYEQAVTEYDNREFSRPYIPHPDLDRNGKSEDSYGNQRRAIVHDHPAIQKPKYYDYHDVRRTSITSMQDEVYLRSGYHLENGKRMPQEYEVSHMGAPEADRLPILRTEYESRRDVRPGLQQERFQSSPMSKHSSETYRQAVRAPEMRQDPGIHEHSDRLMKRKYNANDEIDVHDLRTIKSSKWGATEEFHDAYENEEWVDEEDMDKLYSSGNVEFNPKIYRKYKNEYDELENEEDFPSDEWNIPQGSMGHMRNSFQFRKYSNQNIKHHSKSSSSNWYKSQHFSKRNAIQKQPKVWKKYHGYDENKHAANDESSEDWISAAESEPTEGSEEFNQMVHENFLMYSKKLNLNLYVQRRYQDHGKAGSLYCIACGRRSVFFFCDAVLLNGAFLLTYCIRNPLVFNSQMESSTCAIIPGITF